MPGESKILNMETGLMNYQHIRCMLSQSRILTETTFTNSWHDRCMAGKN